MIEDAPTTVAPSAFPGEMRHALSSTFPADTITGIPAERRRATALSSAENYMMHATYTLTEIATGKAVVTARAVTTVSYDPSGTQRFARLSALHDGERRAAKVISESITTRLASYFLSGS